MFLAVVMLVSLGMGIVIHKLVEKQVLAKCRAWLKIGRRLHPDQKAIMWRVAV